MKRLPATASLENIVDKNVLTGRGFIMTMRNVLLVSIVLLCMSIAMPVQAAKLKTHDSSTTSEKYGKWGVAGAKYGPITCGTCHEPRAGNIKGVRTVINASQGVWSSTRTKGLNVVFNRLTSSSSAIQGVFGDDNRPVTKSSTNVCEVCHTRTVYHRYSSTVLPPDQSGMPNYNHGNRKDCSNPSCHPHKEGFKASCSGCHGNPPTAAYLGYTTGLVGTLGDSATGTGATGGGVNPLPGAHGKHIDERMFLCVYCHRGFTNNSQIDLGFYAFKPGSQTVIMNWGRYTPYSTASNYRFFKSYTGTRILKPVPDLNQAAKCSQVYCHGGGQWYPGAADYRAPLKGGSNTTPNWTKTVDRFPAENQVACGTCHGATNANVENVANSWDSSHRKHAGTGATSSISRGCSTCHGSLVNNDPKNLHVSGGAFVKMTTADPRVGSSAKYGGFPAFSSAVLAPSPTFKACSDLYCHSDGRRIAVQRVYTSVQWGGAAKGCDGCHGGNAAAARKVDTGAHPGHINNATLPANYTCSTCHNSVVNMSSDTTLKSKSLHIDAAIQIKYTGAFRLYGTNSFDTTSLFCSNVYCHSDGRVDQVYRRYTSIQWSSSVTIGCNGCHGKDTGIGYPNYSSSGLGQTTSNSHKAHMQNNFHCNDCHSKTATSDSALKPYSTSHINGPNSNVIDVRMSQAIGGTYNGAVGQKTCSDTTASGCHGAGASPQWGAKSECDTCHGANNNGQLSQGTAGHAIHYNTASKPGGLAAGDNFSAGYAYGCDACHPTNKHKSSFAPYSADVGGNKLSGTAYQPGGSWLTDPKGYYYTNGSCGSAATYCHSNGRGQTKTFVNWTGHKSASNCGVCHNKAGDSPATTTWSRRHNRHINDYADNVNFTCNACHSTVAASNSAIVNDAAARTAHPNNQPTISYNSFAGGTPDTDTDRCQNTKCHSNGQSGVANHVFISWTTYSMSSGCRGCHGGAGFNSPAGDPLTAKHAKHVDGGAGAYAYSCDRCHAKTVKFGSYTVLKNYSGVRYHVNGARDVRYPASLDPAGTYAAGTQICANIYCHSQGRATTGDFTSSAYKPYSTARWNGTMPTNCTGCHGGAAPPSTFRPITTGMHDKHVYNEGMLGTGNNYKCSACHLNIVTSGTDTTLIAGSLNRHVDTIKNYSGVNNGTEASVGKYRPTRNGCYNVNCHTTANPNLVNIGKPYFIPMTSAAYSWKSAPANQCKACHGQTTGAFVGYTDLYGAPSYANNTSTGIKLKNSHRAHVRNLQATYGTNTNLCIECHRRTVNADAPGKLRNYSTYHLARDGGNPVRVVFKQGGTYDTLAKSCSSTASGCHGSSNMAWGGAGSCDACHLAVGGADANENYVYSGGGGAKTSIGGTEWTSTGHGRSGSNYLSGNSPANMDGGLRCYYCHEGGVGHGVATNFFRLKNFSYASYGWGPGGVNGVCMVCHDGTVTFALRQGVGGVKASDNAVVKAAHYGAQHSNNGLRGGGQACWDCHDPHGDSNSYMIHATVAKRSDNTGPNYTFIPISSVQVIFSGTGTPDTMAPSALSDASVTGVSTKICNRCHVYNISGAKNYYTATYSNGLHNTGTNCLASCHVHDGPSGGGQVSAFKGAAGAPTDNAACTSCHDDLYDNASVTKFTMNNTTEFVSYRHYMNNAAGGGTYGTTIPGGASDTVRRCTMCHLDHSYFEPTAPSGYQKKSFNLRASYNSAAGVGTNNDMTICVSCHVNTLFRAYSTPNKEPKAAPIPWQNIGFQNATTIIKNSTHSYAVYTSQYDDYSKFSAVCVKCHNDSIGRNGEGAKSAIKSGAGAQTAKNKFGQHISTVNSSFSVFSNMTTGSFFTGTVQSYSSPTITISNVSGWATDKWKNFNVVITSGTGQNSRRLITASGANTITMASGVTGVAAGDKFDIVSRILSTDNTCFSCHSQNGQFKFNGAGRDWYGVQPDGRAMKGPLEGIFGLFNDESGNTYVTTPGNTSVTVKTKKSYLAAALYGYKLMSKAGITTLTGNSLSTGPDGNGLYDTLINYPNGQKPSGSWKIAKPAIHPLDTYGRHNSYERVEAPNPNGASGRTISTFWNLGDTGADTFQTAPTSVTTITDTNRYWPTVDQFRKQKIYFPNIMENGAVAFRNITTGASGNQQIKFNGSIAINAGEPYYIGDRHVSCGDCHNTHASTHNPEGTISSGDTVGSNYIQVREAHNPRWVAGKWNGYLIKVRHYTGPADSNDNGEEQVRFVTGFTLGADYGQFTVSIPWNTWQTAPTSVGVNDRFEILMGDKWTSAGQSGGRAGSGSSGSWGVKVTGWKTSVAGTFQNSTSLKFTKVENVFDRSGNAAFGGYTSNGGAGQRDLCVRCHSYYSYGNKPPATSTQGPTPTSVLPTKNKDTLAAAGPVVSTDALAEFNPLNASHHAVYARGNNQPLKKGSNSGYLANHFNPNWKRWTGTIATVTSGSSTINFAADMPRTVLPGWFLYIGANTPVTTAGTIRYYEVVEVTGARQITVSPTIDAGDAGANKAFFLTAGLGDAFVPPYGPWSVLRCTDCHGSTKTDPVGPHASINDWMLKSPDYSQKFSWFDPGSGAAASSANAASANGTLVSIVAPASVLVPTDADDKVMFCYNCHRADIYANDAGTNATVLHELLSRANHDALTCTGLGNTASYLTVGWKIQCRFCHGGDKVGGMHGTNTKFTSGTENGNLRKRFLNGAAWVGYSRPAVGSAVSCYTQADQNPLANGRVSNCAQHPAGTSAGTIQYDYW